jgi:cbb3-type cytochrome oxidase maturation protein
MSVVLILILASLMVATGFLMAFIWAVRSGQYEDLSTPSLRMLADDPGIRTVPSDASTPKTSLPVHER